MVKKFASQETTASTTAVVPAKKAVRKTTTKSTTRRAPVRAVDESEGRPAASPEALNSPAFGAGGPFRTASVSEQHNTFGHYRGDIGQPMVPSYAGSGLPVRTTQFVGPVEVPVTLFTHQLVPIGKDKASELFTQLFGPLVVDNGQRVPEMIRDASSYHQFRNFVETFGALVKGDGFNHNFSQIPVCTFWNGVASETFSTSSHANLLKAMIVSRFMSWANDLGPFTNVSYDHLRIHGIALRHVCDDVWTLTLTFYEEDQTQREIHHLRNTFSNDRHLVNVFNNGICSRRLFEVILPINKAK